MSLEQTQVIRKLIDTHDGQGMHPIVRINILKHFLAVRQTTKRRKTVMEQHPLINVTTYTQYDEHDRMICEDVVVETRR